LLICYVDHHDNAYRWAERRKLETHPQTGAAQFVVIRETVIEIAVRKAVEAVAAAAQKPRLFAASADADLLGFGVPQEWLGAVRDATEDTLLDVVEYLPAEAAEALLQLATGGLVPRPEHVSAETSGAGTRSPRHADVSAETSRRAETEPALVAREDELTAEAAEASFAHPDAQRRFRLIENRDELAAALEYPWEKWTTFLHPAQRDLVERIFSGPARVSGSAGTGKTVVALHRAAHLARANRNSRVLLATFSDTLAHALRTKLRRLRRRAAARRKDRRRLPRRHRLETAQGADRTGEARRAGRRLYGHPRRERRCPRSQVQPPVPPRGVGTNRRRMAAGLLGRVPRRCAARPQDARGGDAAPRTVGDLRKGAC
jgi:hypothetical protein